MGLSAIVVNRGGVVLGRSRRYFSEESQQKALHHPSPLEKNLKRTEPTTKNYITPPCPTDQNSL
jgi:hypothetical protein